MEAPEKRFLTESARVFNAGRSLTGEGTKVEVSVRNSVQASRAVVLSQPQPCGVKEALPLPSPQILPDTEGRGDNAP